MPPMRATVFSLMLATLALPAAASDGPAARLRTFLCFSRAFVHSRSISDDPD